MDKNIIKQEDLCLKVKCLCDLLRSNLLEIDTFPGYEKWNKRLKSLKKQVDDIYWSL